MNKQFKYTAEELEEMSDENFTYNRLHYPERFPGYKPARVTKKATVEDSAQITTQKLIESMKQASKAMTVKDAQEFLDELTSKTGIKFNLIVPKKTNLEDLMELYASGNLQRIARDRIKFKEGTDTFKSIYSDFGQLTYSKNENKDYVIEKAVEFEIAWLKEHRV